MKDGGRSTSSSTQDAEDADFGDNFAGWVSSYTGKALSLAEMQEWRDHTVRLIKDLLPCRVLEIGVGTGLLLSRLAPNCQEYWGTDISHKVIGALRQQLQRFPELSGKVQLRLQPAHRLEGPSQRPFRYDCS